jgi:energy-coupling factor transporter ATP-binding protein EcfA2
LRDLKHFKDTGEEIDSLAHLKAVFNEFFSPKKLLGADWVDTPQGPSMRILVETPLGKIDVDQLSAGELEVFSVFGNLDRLKLANSVLLYDEPELHLNAGLERRLLPALEQLAGNSQLIVASHSAQLATAAPWDSIIRMTVEGDNQATRLSEEAERIELYSLLGADVPVQLVSRLIVFVEGLESSLDLAVMRRLLGPHLPGVEFIATGPANAVVALSERAAALMSEAAAYDSYFGVRDRDFLSDGDVEKAAADSAERLHVWRRYHIENYLIETPALHRVAERLGLGLSLDQVEDSVRAIADSMKEVVVAQALAARVNNRIERFDLAVSGGADPVGVTMSKIRRSRESFTAGFDDSALSVFADSVRSEIEVSWSENWKALCPGRPLLRRLAGEWNLPYDRLRSLILAELAAEDDVDEEIKQLRTRLRELTPTA